MEDTDPPSNGADGGYSPCECQQSTSRLMGEINQTSEGLSLLSSSPQPPQKQPVYLDGALLLGRRLALEWERINGCANVEHHLQPAALLSTVKTIEQVLKLYEMLLETLMESSSSAHVNGKVAHSATNPSSSSSSSPSQSQFAMVPVTLGSLELNDEEARVVVEEALRHTISRLGDMLKDIEDEIKQVMTSRNSVLEDVKRALALMLRLLGRIPK